MSSIGLPSWELSTYLAGRKGLNLELIIPQAEPLGIDCYREKVLSDYRLEREKTVFHLAGEGSKTGFMAARDRLAFDLADIVCPVSVRPGGRLEKFLAEYRRGPGRVREEFGIQWRRVAWRPRYELENSALNPELEDFNSGWLFHWTHTHPGKWPDEEPWRFYSDMLEKPEVYVRDARTTLGRIMCEGVLRASAWRMPAGCKAVSLTALSPDRAAGLMRWRKRYLRYSLEPFGLAFRRDLLRKLGAAPVHYFDPLCGPPEGIDRLFCQSAGQVGKWTAEEEWRFPGDLELKNFSRDMMILIAVDTAEAAKLKQETGSRWRIISFLTEKKS